MNGAALAKKYASGVCRTEQARPPFHRRHGRGRRELVSGCSVMLITNCENSLRPLRLPSRCLLCIAHVLTLALHHGPPRPHGHWIQGGSYTFAQLQSTGRTDRALARTFPCSATTPTLQNRSSPRRRRLFRRCHPRARARVVCAVSGESVVWPTYRTGERSANFTAGVNDKP